MKRVTTCGVMDEEEVVFWRDLSVESFEYCGECVEEVVSNIQMDNTQAVIDVLKAQNGRLLQL